jgi:hypothetical protein
VVGQPDFVLRPWVCGPDGVPVIADPEQARRQPQLAVISAMAHGDGPDSKAVLDALMAALDISDLEHADLYASAVLKALTGAARRSLVANMAKCDRVFHLDFLQESYEKGEASGQAKGEARAIFAVLRARGLDVPDHVSERITTCTDPDLLETWVARAVTASTVDDLFDMPDAA